MAKLFFTLAVLCLFGAVMAKGFSQSALQLLLSHLATCKQEVGADDANIREIMYNTGTLSMKAKCLFACIMKKTKLMDENGKFAKDVALNFVKSNADGNEKVLKIAEEIINKCGDIKVDDNHCEAAIQYAKCFKQELDGRKLQ